MPRSRLCWLPSLALLLPACFDPTPPRDEDPTTPELSDTTSDAATDDAPTSGAATPTQSTPAGSSAAGSSSIETTMGIDDSTNEMTAITTGIDTTEGQSSEASSSTGMACVPGPEVVEFESLGDFVAQGDAWQSFTSSSTGDIVEVDVYWNLSGTNDQFTINIYEGEGTGGTLLHSELFPGQGMGTFVGFDINVLNTPVPIEAGMAYTVQGLDTFGWQTANGAIPGGNSSLGPAQHKNIRVWVEPCI